MCSPPGKSPHQNLKERKDPKEGNKLKDMAVVIVSQHNFTAEDDLC
jgi:hypothetical protein